jgi:antagonist of KipI
MTLHIRKPGIFTTVQNLGRSGYRSLGVNPGGAMDRTAVRLINTLIGNDENSAVLEMHFPAAKLVFESDVVFAIGGANFGAELDERSVKNWRCISAKAGSTLRFCDRIKGNRAYLAIAGGIKFERPPGSPSTPFDSATDFEIFETERRKILDEHTRVSTSLIPIYSRFPTVRVLDGPEAYLLTEKNTEHLFSEMFTVLPASNRMGFRLKGKPLSLSEPFEMVSSAVSFGTVQLLPDGQLIVLMADHQTTGGYPRTANVASVDLPLMAQLGAGDKVSFHKITVGEAEELAMQFERDLALMKLGIRLRT